MPDIEMVKPEDTKLIKAKKVKNDEFYTLWQPIQAELEHYEEHFRGKTVMCNCDDPHESNYVKYFFFRFNSLGLKRLIATCYKSEDKNSFSKHDSGKAVYYIYDGPQNNKNEEELKNLDVLHFKGNGDFRSPECIDLLQEADIICTNPPFSLFREYVDLLVKHNKKFLIIGNPNAITYKETFRHIKANKMWIGFKPMGTDMLFDVPPYFAKWLVENKKEGSGYRRIKNKVQARSQAIWFTNLEHSKRNEEIPLFLKYNPKDYPKYINYDAIEVSRVNDIPVDYYDKMGVPITFMGKYNPDQFEIIGLANDKRQIDDAFVQGDEVYLDDKHKRFVGMVLKEGDKLRAPFARIIIQRKQ